MMKLRVISMVLVVLGSPIAVFAQEQPLAVFPPAPPPGECVVDPVDEQALQTPTGDRSEAPLVAPAEPMSPLSLFPNSESPDSAARKEIETLERQLAACYNAGDWRRAASLYTRSYLARIVVASGDRVDEFFPREPEPLDRLIWMMVKVDDVRRVDNGRIAALVSYCGYKQVHYYRMEANEWRLDDALDVRLAGESACLVLDPTATPVTP